MSTTTEQTICQTQLLQVLNLLRESLQRNASLERQLGECRAQTPVPTTTAEVTVPPEETPTTERVRRPTRRGPTALRPARPERPPRRRRPERVQPLIAETPPEPAQQPTRPSRPRQPTLPSEAQTLTLTFPEPLASCTLVQQILSIPCAEQLNYQGYHELSSTRSITFPGHGTLYYSVLDSIMTHLARSTETACVGGHIDLLLFGRPDDDPESQQVIEAATNFDLGRLSAMCSNRKLVYVPLSAMWTEDPGTRVEAERLGSDFFCTTCPAGHAMAVLITTTEDEKTIEYFEPNGKEADWWAVIASYLDRLFKASALFKDYAIQEAEACPAYGPQAGTGISMCSYFSSLYAAIRITCGNLDGGQIVDQLLALGRGRMPELLRRWHCWLVDYARRNGIFEARDTISDLYSRAINFLINLPNDADTAAYWQRLRRVEDTASSDLLEGVAMLRQLNDELQARTREQRQQAGVVRWVRIR